MGGRRSLFLVLLALAAAVLPLASPAQADSWVAPRSTLAAPRATAPEESARLSAPRSTAAAPRASASDWRASRSNGRHTGGGSREASHRCAVRWSSRASSWLPRASWAVDVASRSAPRATAADPWRSDPVPAVSCRALRARVRSPAAARPAPAASALAPPPTTPAVTAPPSAAPAAPAAHVVITDVRPRTFFSVGLIPPLSADLTAVGKVRHGVSVDLLVGVNTRPRATLD